MHVFQETTIKVVKAGKTGDVFSRVLELLKSEAAGEPKIRFRFEELDKDATSKRTIKRFPELKLYHYEQIGVLNNSTLQVFSNLDERFSEPNANGAYGYVPLEALETIASGIPRSYSFWHAQFIFEGLPQFDLRSNLETPPLAIEKPYVLRSTVPGICLVSDWWTTRRQIHLSAMTVQDAPDDDVPDLPTVTPETRALLERLGKTSKPRQIILPNQTERAALEEKQSLAQGIVDTFREDPFHRFKGTKPTPPESLRGATRGTTQFEWKMANLPSPKKVLTDTYKPLGFRYNSSDSGRGRYSFKKQTNENNRINVSFDLSPMMGEILGSFSLTGPAWGFGVSFQFLGVSPYNDHIIPIVNEAALRYAAHTSSMQAIHLEETFAPQLEEIYGPAPAWFQ